MSKKKYFLAGFSALVLVFLRVQDNEILHIASTHAQIVEAGSLEASIPAASRFAAWAVMVMSVLGLICIRLVEFLMSPQLYSTMMSDTGALKDLWLLSRDIMNILFAFMLLGMAFYTIIIGKAEKIKENIVWFVLAVVLVNFSWFFPRVILDIANVMTATIMTIPSEVGLNGECKVPTRIPVQGENGRTEFRDGPPKDCEVLTRVELNVDRDSVTCDNANSTNPVQNGDEGFCRCFKTEGADNYPICWWTVPFSQAGGARGSGLVGTLAVNFGKIMHLPLVTRGNESIIENDNKIQLNFPFLIGLAFSFIFSIALVFPLLALSAGLLLRIIILWATIAFMPFSFLGFVINKGKLGTDIFGIPINIWKEFLNAAFLPTIVAVPFSIGFMLILTGANMAPPAGAPFVFNMALLGDVTDYWQMLWSFAGIMVIWIGAFTALKRSEIIGSITERIKATGQALGGAAAKLPLLTPIPVPGGKPIRLGQLVKGPQNLNAAMSGIAFHGENMDDFRNRFRGGRHIDGARIKGAAQKLKDNHIDELNAKVKKFADINSTADEKRDAMRSIRDIFTKNTDIKEADLRNDEDVIGLLTDLDKELQEKNRGTIDNAALQKAKDALQKPQELRDIIINNTTPTTISFINTKGENKVINFQEQGHDLNTVQGKKHLIDELGVGGMKINQENLIKVQAALNLMSNRPELQDATKTAMKEMIQFINKTETGKKYLDAF